MYEVCAAILHCAEYNFEKLIKHRGKPKSPEEFLCWKLEFGIAECVKFLLMCEKYHWNKINRSDCRNTGSGKNAPVKLRKRLVGLLKSSAAAERENERIAKLRAGIMNAIKYLRKIKEDDNYLNSKALQDVYECLENLLELKISPITKTNNQEDCL